jgi:hypothetical protein
MHFSSMACHDSLIGVLRCLLIAIGRLSCAPFLRHTRSPSVRVKGLPTAVMLSIVEPGVVGHSLYG